MKLRFAARRKRAFLGGIVNSVDTAVERIRALGAEDASDRSALEHGLIPALGLNDEELQEMPPELAQFYGTGLHLWQYPSQLSRLLIWMGENARNATSYCEIGCRWGGMAILMTEWLMRYSDKFTEVIAVDPMVQSPFLARYSEILAGDGVQLTYLQDFSTSQPAHKLIDRVQPDVVFIDGDHSLGGALKDHLMVRDVARIIVHHDIASDPCPDTTLLWSALKQLESGSWELDEFADQYDSVDGNALGIGAMRRKP